MSNATNKRQSEVLVSWMEKYSDIANGFTRRCKEEQNEIWKKLKDLVESIENNGPKDITNFRNLQEKLNDKVSEMEELKRQHSEQCKEQDYENIIKKLEADLSAALNDVENRTHIDHAIGDQFCSYADEIKTLKAELTNSKREKEKMDKEVQALKKEVRKYAEAGTQLLIMKDRVKHLESENETLNQTIRDLENKLESSEHLAFVNREFHDELKRLQASENEKSQNIEVLEAELCKAHCQNQKLEEKIAMDGKLLEVRSSLIETLQTKENSQKVHLEDLFSEVGDRKNDIQMLKVELLSKTEELQNLFTTLSAKQLEVTRQEHMINLLQESNQRVQTLRVKQESKIGRLEEEVSQLKRTLSLYQDAILPNNAIRNSLLLAETCLENDCNENLEYYVDEQRRMQRFDDNSDDEIFEK